MDWNNQLTKGMFELAILLLVSKKAMYGYEITKELQKVNGLQLANGSIYPILRRLTMNGWIESYQEDHGGRSRKYYFTTKEGNQILSERFEFIEQLFSFIVSLKEGNDKNERI
ncbi:PadR family transcriptional regulator [Evansella sp. AB-P1]|uniref:PadR family transcriptional regulator n=1 Tax=Evansella sp. AB-P1 TaxID=3037653 RepID=UPI00241E9698|nr:PadR family transcriptional regulator [Evansella sp. AB-P1]MDG5790009.1 PadR family transcriptional regulator [Evansella sp. AB-P1]